MFPKNSSLLKSTALIGSDWRAAQDGATISVHNPSTCEHLGDVPKMGAIEAKEAVDAASAALPAWRKQTAKARSAILYKWYQLLLTNSEELAKIMTAEQGKPLAEARGEVAYGASFLQWFAEEAKRGGGEIIPAVKDNTQVRVTREAAGVAAMITPWNFPIAMITRKLGPALACGCTAVIKPANLTPLSALAVIELGKQAGVPDGVINIITGDSNAIGNVWCADDRVRVLSFTGSTEVGAKLAALCAPTVKKLALELGGNAPFIVFEDADLALAAKQAILSKFRNAGQTCVCANRFYVQSSVYDEFLSLFKNEIAALQVGDGFAEGTTIGPLINQAAVEKAAAHVADARAKGATVLFGGERLEGHFFQPTLLADMQEDMLPSCEETFAPIAPVYRFDSEYEAIARANATPFGLAAYFCSRDLGRVMRVSAALEAGIIGVNEGIISTEVAPFGGVKQSGLGREGAQQGMDEYSEIKYTLIGYAGSA
ncbi:MAG: NAD-dependent succinate-semialdehyde dehydrogenase [Proteobacteria bacterium]|nr:NAD-dependent succinate-semialdehyde dehydrogenase [Pseudomonadota bacterium]